VATSKSHAPRPFAARVPRGRPVGSKVECRTQGPAIVWPKGVEARYNISKTTRWLWEQQGKLPPRDVYIGGKAEGWRPATLEAAEAGPTASAAEPGKVKKRRAA
jgi:predicted DNA-binding transcriptional regulator AlpA